MLEIKGLVKSFHSRRVIDHLDLHAGRGEIIHIKGQNGCGKSTLFKIICDILDKDEGTIHLDDGVKIGALIENPGFLENRTLKENLKYLLSLTRSQVDEAHLRKLCTFFFLDLEEKSKMKAYSVGIRQKAGIIQAVMEGQDLILFDEPTRGLDEESVGRFGELVTQLANEGKCVVIASHDTLDDIVFTSRYRMDGGKLRESAR